MQIRIIERSEKFPFVNKFANLVSTEVSREFDLCRVYILVHLSGGRISPQKRRFLRLPAHSGIILNFKIHKTRNKPELKPAVSINYAHIFKRFRLFQQALVFYPIRNKSLQQELIQLY